MDMYAALQQALDNTGKIVAQVDADQFALPTPCAKFDVKALLSHMVGGQHLLVASADGPVAQPSDGAFDDVSGDVADAYRRSSKAVADLFGTAGIFDRTFQLGVDVPGEQALGIALMEAVVHGWDLATAIDVPTGIDPAIAEMLLAASHGFVAEGFRSPEGHPFGPAVEIADDATAEQRLAAFLGRQP